MARATHLAHPSYPAGPIRLVDDGAGPPVLLLHGSFSTANAWRAMIAFLAPRFRVLAPDLAGYGDTPAPTTGDTVDHHVAVVRAVAAHAGAPVHLVGHSAGGCVALAAAVRGVTGLASLTLIDATAVHALPLTGDTATHQQIRVMYDAYRADHAAGNADAAHRVIDFWTGPGASAALPSKLRDHIAATTHLNFRDWSMIWQEATTATAYATVTTPTLVLHGSDSTAPIAAISTAIGALLPVSTQATIPGASHVSITTHAGAVAGFVAGHIGTASRTLSP